MKIGTVAGGVGIVTTIDVTWLPEFFFYNPPSTPSSFKLEILGEGVMIDLEGAGQNILKDWRKMNSAADLFYIPAADGIIKGKQIQLTVVSSHATAFDIYGSGDNAGTGFMQTMQQTILANSGTEFTKFAALFLPNLAATDSVTITYEDDLVQIWNLLDLEGFSSNYQVETHAQVDNLEGTIRNLNVLVGIQQVCYLTRFVMPKTGVTSSPAIGG